MSVPRLHPPHSEAVSVLQKGQLVVWKDERGFGFIRPDAGGPDVFLHISALRERPRRPCEGDTVCYHVATGPDGKLRAEDALLLSAVRPSQPISAPASPLSLFVVLALTALVLLASAWFWRAMQNPLPLLVYPSLSAITYGMYAHDKDCAMKGAWRVPESTLHALEFFGGWPGGGIAQQLLRHKNRKEAYQIVFWLIALLHVAGWFGFGLWSLNHRGSLTT